LLRSTVLALAKRDTKLNRQAVSRIVEAIHGSFSPRIPWTVKCILVRKYHVYKMERHPSWSAHDTAKGLEIHYQYTYDSLRLYRYLVRFPILEQIKARKTALRIIAIKTNTVDYNVAMEIA